MTIADAENSDTQDGAGDDGATSAVDGDAGSVGLSPDAGSAVPDGVDGQDVEQTAPESAPYEAPKITEIDPPQNDPVNERDVLVEVTTAEDGYGTAMVGLDPDSIAEVRLINAKGKVAFEPSHTVSISRVIVSDSNVSSGTVLVAVTPKQ